MRIKKLFIFPTIAMVLLLVTLFLGLITAVQNGGNVGIYIVVALACLIPLCVHTITLVGSLRNSIKMVIVGTCVVLVLSYGGNIFLGWLASQGASEVSIAMIWVCFAMTAFISIIIFIAGLVSMNKGGNSPLLMVAAILGAAFYLVFSILVIINSHIPSVLVTGICFTTSFLVILGSMLAISLVGIKQGKEQAAATEAVAVEEKPAVAKVEPVKKVEEKPAEVDVTEELLKWKKLLDAGAITQEDYDKKKADILNR